MTTSLKLIVAVVQQQYSQDTEANLATSLQLIRQAAQHGAQLVLLSELHRSLYFCQTETQAAFALAEPLKGPTCQRLGQLAQELQIVIVGSIFERRAAGIYHNTALVLDVDGQLAGYYRKMHIPDDPGFYEKYYFTPGDLGFTPVDCSLGRLGVLICWDQWYPEAARLMALAGAELLLYPTAIGWEPDEQSAEKQRQLEAWITIQRSHAIANHLPVLSCNRTGFEASPEAGQGIVFWGNSFIAGAQGEILAQAPADQPQVLLATVDRARTETLRQIWPYFRDRRIDAYPDLLRRYRDRD